jgi:septum formation protein
MTPLLILASASPRRTALLQQIRVPHRVQPVDIDESPLPAEAPADYVQRLAAAKAQTLWGRLALDERLPVLGADTTVALGDTMFGKPRDRDAGLKILEQLSGRTHRVYTAVALCRAEGTDIRLNVSEVSFRRLSAAEREAYWSSGEPQDKAGAYAVQGLAAAFITRVCGSYSGVMGLPLAEIAEMLSAMGWSI